MYCVFLFFLILTLVCLCFLRLRFLLVLHIENVDCKYSMAIQILNRKFSLVRGKLGLHLLEEFKVSSQTSKILVSSLKQLFYKRKITYEQIRLQWQFGIDDPCWDALLYGAGLMLFSVLPIFLKEILNARKVFVKIQPSFQKLGFQMETACIVSVTLANIISVLLEQILKKGGGTSGTSNS